MVKFGAVVICLCSTFDFLVFNVISRLLCVFVCKWPVTLKGLVKEQNRVNFLTQVIVNHIGDTFDLVALSHVVDIWCSYLKMATTCFWFRIM